MLSPTGKVEGSEVPAWISRTLKSLQELDITLEILVGTGVGKTVNGFRKHTEVGDFAKSIVLQWKKLVPEVIENDEKSMPKHEPKETIERKQSILKLKKKEAVVEKVLNSEGNNHWSEELPESQTTKNKSNKTKKIKEYEKKPESKEMKPKKDPQGKEDEEEKAHSNFHSKGEKSKRVHFSEKRTEKYSHSSNNEKKHVYTKNKESPPKHSRHNKNNESRNSFQPSVEKTAETLPSEEFETPSMSFESYLNYDQASSKRKNKSYLTNEPPNKVQVCNQYCKMKRSSSELQKSPKKKKEEQVDETDTKKRCLEDLLSIPLPKFLPDFSMLPSPPYAGESKGNIPEPVSEISPETSGFTGKRLNSKMLVYSGSKTIYLPKMLTLYQQCIRVLQNNIDSIQEVGGVPFEILQPVLERCTPEQLNRIEECNPDFMEESDNLWRKHCEKDFKGHQLLEYESWREMYLRLFSAREEKLKMITQNISSTYSGKPKGRQVKLAYIHGAAKPPRYIRRKQEINGTAVTIVQPHPVEKLKLQKIESKEPSISNTIVPVSNSQHGGPSQDTKKTIKKIAPMMAKSMRAFKNRVGPR
ncbi:PREDICTED: transcription elongation factor B polypeptide 3-like [Nanorana parkeri]|uniref:transcription elongation factor B polypeptide 3-like n=1 Tax=Nanorana parkeri TaxID=125878 RepID=UPI0008542CAF|nr:PREDICTED: transcription elongation factor B polypeptide 3-like [Nanorana parkeri]